MIKLTWKRARENLRVTENGMPVKSYTGQMISYPYIAIGREYYNSNNKDKNTWKVTLVEYSWSKNLGEFKLETDAKKFAKKWMEEHPEE